jgi:hypothetical protein
VDHFRVDCNTYDEDWEKTWPAKQKRICCQKYGLGVMATSEGWRGLMVILMALEWGKSMQRSEIRLGRYHLVITNSAPWKITIFKRETIYFYGPSIPWLC